MKQHIPNAITCLNLFSGCVGVVFAFNGNFVFAVYAIVIAAVFDFMDGMVARLLKVHSPVGKELDSLADLISFGFLPASIVYQLFLLAPQVGELSTYLNYTAFIIAVFSALRLAKFNTDTRQSDNFIGLPTPANALFIGSLPMIIAGGDNFWTAYILNPFFLFVLAIGTSFLLVMEIPLLSLKFKNFIFRENLLRFLLVFIALILIVLFKFAAVPLIIVLYIVFSFIQFTFLR